MGQKVPTSPGDFGNDCLICSPPFGSRWATGETPAFVYVLFTGLVECPLAVNSPPNGRTFKLIQSGADPCVWWSVGSLWTVRFYTGYPAVNPSAVWLHDFVGRPHFLGDSVSCPPEYQTFANNNTVCSPVIESIDGTAIVFWMAEVLELVADYNLSTEPQLMYELALHSSGDFIHKFCDQGNTQNIKFRIP